MSDFEDTGDYTFKTVASEENPWLGETRFIDAFFAGTFIGTYKAVYKNGRLFQYSFTPTVKE